MEKGIDSLIPRDEMSLSAKLIRDFYDVKPGARIFRREFGWYVLDKWIEQGYLKPRNGVENYDAYLRGVFGFDEPGVFTIQQLGGCEGALLPRFEEKVLEDRGDYELVRDFAGRSVLCFKGRRSGFMPEFVYHEFFFL